MNPKIQKLQAYPFERLVKLKAQLNPPDELEHIALSIGEPKHPAPEFVLEIIKQHLSGLSRYPLTKGMSELRQGIASWLCHRFALAPETIDPEQHILPVSGTREALFSFAQSIIDPGKDPLVLMPNPFYQIYEGAALLAGAEPWFLNTTDSTDLLPNFASVPDKIWQRCQLVYICSPGNPTGKVIPADSLQDLLELAEKHDFIIAADECYSEIYFDKNTPPVGLLQVASAVGNIAYKRCVVFHSLSKRSNLPGLRSGFVAGDKDILARYLKYRTYHGCAISPPFQWASIAAWSDEKHVQENRELYRKKFDAVLNILKDSMNVSRPDAGFYLWPKLPADGTEFTKNLFAQKNVTVLPGQYLSRNAHGENPGQQRIRMALVADIDNCIEAALRIKQFIENN